VNVGLSAKKKMLHPFSRTFHKVELAKGNYSAFLWLKPMNMTRKILLIVLFGAALMVTLLSASDLNSSGDPAQWKNGDVIFQQSQSRQCKAISLATHSEWTHCGVVFLKDGKWIVAEAVEPVVFTPVDEFISRGKNGRVEVRRLNRALTSAEEKAMWAFLAAQGGKHYDIGFHWSDHEMYCSELVWKAYNAAGVGLTEPRPMRSFDLSSPLVKSVMQERYGDDVPLDEPMVSPGDLFLSEHLIEP
jgi:hypothetical protein